MPPKPSFHAAIFSFLRISFVTAALWNAAFNGLADGLPQASLTVDDLDPAAFVGWMQGREQAGSELSTDGPKAAIWTRTSRPDLRGVTFGDSSTPGPRHLRIGLKAPTQAGSVIVRGGGQLSVLRADANYPGDPNKDEDWTPAERLEGTEVTRAEVDREDIAVWTLPPGTKTRALRFTHLAAPADPKYAGWLGGALLLPARVANLAPQAMIVASEGDETAAKVINSQDESWKSWDNGKDGGSHVVSGEQPVTLTLIWPKAVTLRGLETLWTGFGAADAQAFAGTAEQHPRDVDAAWKTIKSFSAFETGYPLPFWPNVLDFGETVTTRAVRLRITGSAKESHPHLKGRTADGKRVWLGELLALHSLGDADLKTALLPATKDESHPPIPVKFTLAEPSYVTLVIEDAEGKRVRNLVSETRFPVGENIAWWDGTDDLGRDRDAAKHGLYHIPGAPIPPGSYRVRGLFRKELELRYEFSIYNPGNPPWETADKTGGWLTNHTPPQAAIFIPADKAPTGQPTVYLGSAVSEGGAGLAWVDLHGKKLGGRGWVGGNWTAAPYLARDEGAKADASVFAYVGSTWTASTDNRDQTHGELRITALTAKDDKPILKYPFTPPAGDDGDHHWIDQLGGIAVRDGLLVTSLTKLGALIFVDTREGKVLGTLPMESPHGLVFDPQGRLLTLTGSRLVRLTLPPDLDQLARHLLPDSQSGVPLPTKSWSPTASKQSSRAALALDGNKASRWDTGGPMQRGDSFSLDLNEPRTFFKITMTASASDDYARGYEVFVSDDGQNWGKPLAQGNGERGRTSIVLPQPVTKRFVKIVQTGNAQNYWSIDELTLDTPMRAEDQAKPLPLRSEPLVIKNLEDPRGLTLDAKGRIFVSDRGASHQVKVFAPDGKFSHSIGHAGAPKAGLYDPLHLNHPHGLAIDEKQQLWVTENDFQPKRVSVWTLDGKLVRAFYGPGRYGGGGTLDPRDKTRFYYDGIEFKLDWKTGASEPAAILHRDGDNDLQSQFRAGPPETPIYFKDRQYLTNCFNSSPTSGHPLATIWALREHVAVPVASLGRANDWQLLQGEAFSSRWPMGLDPKGDRSKNAALFAWSDLNGDARVQPEEVTIIKATSGGVTVMPDLSFLVARVDDRAMRFAPQRFTDQGAPVFDLSAGETLATGAQSPASSGGDQALTHPDGWTLLTNAPQPFAKEGFGGLRDNKPLWSYPSLWPGLHASHEAAVPDRPGEVIGSTRLLGGFITLGAPGAKDREVLWCINGNMGDAYLFTADGLFVAQLFQDSRTGKPWTMPAAERGTLLNELTLHDENFFPTISQTSDGQVYLCNGSRMSLVRIDGLNSIHRLPTAELKVTVENLQAAAAWRVQAEQERQRARGTGTLTIALRKTAPVVDGKLDDWAGADWAVIDRRGTAANFNSDSKPYDVTAAVAVSGDRLYAAFRTQDAELLKNSGETPNAPFKTGGCLDLMLGVNPAADPKRTKPAAGDQRLLVTQLKGQTHALLYRAVVPGTKEPVPFSSPWRTITLDRVDNISADVQLAMSVEKDEKGKPKSAFYELSVPLATLGITPTNGQAIKGDLGILRGNGFQTLQRVYWNNKATGITADVPSEAELTPALWGKWQFKATP
jgi:hypothetical protein